MIQNINKKYNNDYFEYDIQDNDYIIVATPREVLIKQSDNMISFPMYKDIEKCDNIRFLFKINDDKYFMALNVTMKSNDFEFVEKNIFRTAYPFENRFIGITGFQLVNWYMSHNYCSRCGTPLIHSKKERMLECPECKMQNYPTISPAVIVGLVKKDSICISKYAGRDYKNYALLAGFVEVGESIEDTVRREVFEEVHLKVKNIRYFNSQPWGFTSTLLIGVFADLDGEDTIVLDEEELSEARFIKRDEMDDILDDGITLTRAMMMAFKEGREPQTVVH